MKFIHDDFMLENDDALRLYHDYAECMPIIDYHCHLPPQDVADDKRWDNLSQVWLSGDHINGVQCVPTELMKGFVPEMRPIAKSLISLRKPCRICCVILCIIGRILSWRDILI